MLGPDVNRLKTKIGGVILLPSIKKLSFSSRLNYYCANRIFPRPTPVAMATKFGTYNKETKRSLKAKGKTLNLKAKSQHFT